MSLGQRVVLAVVLTVGFYVMALAIIAALIAVVVFVPNVDGRVFGFCIIGAAVIAISIIPWPRRFMPPGPLLNPEGQPRLFAELQGVARTVGEAMPAEVYITPEMNAGVLQRGRKRVMVLRCSRWARCARCSPMSSATTTEATRVWVHGSTGRVRPSSARCAWPHGRAHCFSCRFCGTAGCSCVSLRRSHAARS